ncbi:pentatricopeptide repeat-containing protein At3g49240, mitochondrial-like [Zingiber officinale]|uniref:Pentatricopeptide repeat-containing protein n=1 Tax=Zingiber officinale TaxID=94328 RepID=A0A8J5FLR4_ZINOF|nr:pentatricopeptide repeat-containing protein At3g49240, mitochondrial-like [Zingiber officinale]KAG6490882.1 hypothetical protein ZIOFF_052212 [Zingiber officinale]
MALSKTVSFSCRLKPYSFPSYFATASRLRFLSFATAEDAAAERRRRKRRLRIEPPLSSLRNQRQPPSSAPPRGPRTAPNPNAPKLPEPVSALVAKRLDLHNRILKLVRENDLDEAALFTRHSIYSNCRPTIFTVNAVLNALIRQCRYADFLSLHRFITQASVAPNIITVNLLLQAYCDCRKTDIALEHFRLLLKDDAPFPPSATTYRILAKGLVDNGKIEQAVELKDDMLAKAFVAPDPVVYNHIMQGFLKKGDPDTVVSLFEELQEKLGGGKVLDGIVYGNLMKGYFGKGLEEQAMEIYRDVLGEGSKVRLESVSYNLVLDALGRNGKLEEALNLFDRMLKEHNPPRRITVNLGTFNVMVDAYCIAGRFQDAITVFGQMSEQKCVPDTLSYNNLIDQLGSNKFVAEAEVLYKEMSERGISPDEYTYVLLVEACFGMDRVDDATGYFQKMVELGLRPNATAYNKVVGGLVNVAHLDEAKKFFDQMLEKEVKPNVSSYELLLKGFIDAGRLDDGLKTLKDLLLDDGVTLSEEMKGLVEEALKKEGREEEMGKLLEDVEREKAERLAREAEEKARAEALAREEEENKKKEAAEKEAAAAKASAAAIEAILGRKKDEQGNESSADSKSANAVIEGEILDGGLNEEEKLRAAHDSQEAL